MDAIYFRSRATNWLCVCVGTVCEWAFERAQKGTVPKETSGNNKLHISVAVQRRPAYAGMAGYEADEWHRR